MQLFLYIGGDTFSFVAVYPCVRLADGYATVIRAFVFMLYIIKAFDISFACLHYAFTSCLAVCLNMCDLNIVDKIRVSLYKV